MATSTSPTPTALAMLMCTATSTPIAAMPRVTANTATTEARLIRPTKKPTASLIPLVTPLQAKAGTKPP
jgi:hypothetical protein